MAGDVRAALREACSIASTLHDATHAHLAAKYLRLSELLDLADAPPRVLDLLDAPEFRDGTRGIRYDDHDLRHELRRQAYPRQRGQAGPDVYYVAMRTTRADIVSVWVSWTPNFGALDALGTLVEVDRG